MLDFLYFFSKELFHLPFDLDIYEFLYTEGILYFQSFHDKETKCSVNEK